MKITFRTFADFREIIGSKEQGLPSSCLIEKSYRRMM
jgi:hypothetical protein